MSVNSTRIKGPGIPILNTQLKSISEFENFRHSVLFNLRQDLEFRPYLKKGLTWGAKSPVNPTRNVRDDPGRAADPPTGQTAEEKCEIIDFLLETIAQYCPLIPHNDIVNQGSLEDVWQLIRLHSNIETTGGLLNSVWNITREPNESPQALWSRLKQQYDDCLLRADTLKYVDAKLVINEAMSPTLHNVIILHWLQLIHPKMRDMVTQRFSKELRDATYASIWPEISRSIDSFLKDLSEEPVSVCRYDTSSNPGYNRQRYSDSNRFPSRGRGFQPSLRGSKTNRSQGKCDYCRVTGRRAWYNHSIEECLFLKKERPLSSRAVEVTEEFDDHQAEFDEEYGSSPDAVQGISIINLVSSKDSPVLTLYKSNKEYRVIIDTGGERSVMDDETARELECELYHTDERALMADGVTELNVLGKTQVVLTRNSKSFTINALVCEMNKPTILAGMPFLVSHDIAIRPARSEIILDGSEVVKYDSKSQRGTEHLHRSRRISSYTVRSQHNTVILPGEDASFPVPNHLREESTVAVEPRQDNSHYNSLSRQWPMPKVYDISDGNLRLTNSSNDPIIVKKNQHICNIQLQVRESEVSKSMSDAAAIQLISNNVKPQPVSTTLPAKKVTLYSGPVKLNPDKVLSTDESSKFATLLEEYDEIFNPVVTQYNQKSGKCYVEVNMGPIPPPQHKGKVPFYGRNNLIALQDKFDELVKKGVLKRPQDIGVTVENLNTSFLVKKKDTEEMRFVTDFASIKDYCRPTPTLMPDCDSTLREISSWNYIISTDFTTAYYALQLKRSSMKYAGVVSPMKGVFVYTVGCMGLPGTEVALEELTSLLFGHMVMEGKVAKLADDLFIGGATVKELLTNFEEVLGILLKNNLKLKARKTYIAPKSVTLLGWVWSSGNMKASPHKLSALSECDPPPTVKALKSWIGAFRHLSRVVKRYGEVLQPLESILSGKYVKETAANTKITWSDELLCAFKKAQSALKDAKAITLPQQDDVLHIVTDAAVQPSAIGATLYVIRGEKTLLGGFFNAKLPPFQKRWLPCELEGVAIGMSLSHFSPYILQSNHKPVVLTDSKACVDAVKKLGRGEYSTSARLCTFLAMVSRYGATVQHIQGCNNILSDYISRNPLPCSDPKCQVCRFINESINSVVANITVSDLMEGKSRLPFTNKAAWIEIQSECADLRMVIKYLRSGTTPGKKGRNLRLVKQYLNSKVIISNEGTLVVRQIEPFLPQTERIVIPQTVIHGILTAIHILTSHPSASQLMKVFNRFFFALKLEPAASQVTKSCHQCSSLRDIPKALQKESTDPAPEYITQRGATDVIKRNGQLILVLREGVSSYTQSLLIPRETSQDISEGLIMLANLIRPSDMTPMVIRADPHTSHRSLFNSNDSILSKHNIQLEIGREHNVNHNPVAEKAVREMIKEILILQPTGGPISNSLLSEATANLNSRIRAPGVSAHEIFTQRDQTTGHQLTIDDIKLINDQLKRRSLNHKASEKCKAGGRPALPNANVSVGSIVYIYSDGSKLRARPRYVVLTVKDDWCTARRLAEKQLGRITYSIKLSECYLVPDETADVLLPPYPVEEEEDDTYVVKLNLPTKEAIPVNYDVRTDSESGESSGEEESVIITPEEESYCTICHREVATMHQGLICDNCEQWSHRYCLKMTKKRYKELMREEDLQWRCPSCPLELQIEGEPEHQVEEEPPDALV